MESNDIIGWYEELTMSQYQCTADQHSGYVSNSRTESPSSIPGDYYSRLGLITLEWLGLMVTVSLLTNRLNQVAEQ